MNFQQKQICLKNERSGKLFLTSPLISPRLVSTDGLESWPFAPKYEKQESNKN